ncbi:MAG: FAD-dependent oxidoreductase [Gammaproteobacteria bacterium]|jgi:dimethylamine/trimethylamine dehydrogenase|nr:FAD-dependent oxidoreductase [Gammaproteobacteria bacterium]MBT3867482.1 FAD-dependent oxidoreductase [Gammaproteobacteria bacterium]MBT4616969.1 FAD-dependent oxidoreductase [Gammaproteobacteria bacterium]MBT5198286.1 FAD-dependent oxidoreductase [Gammaproteobacteria bacterium]MBT5444462.1 FAD-dependent oxidoreductase [Gammaproteobacteria bacterium]
MNPRYQILFEPVTIGPVTAPNRFYQVPHASGMTEANPRVRAAFRETKAEGGWGVVSTGAVSTHPSSDDSPLPFARLWDDNDIRSHAMTCDAIHKHGSLAAIELWHGGASVMNRSSRLAPYSPSGIPWAATHVGFMGNQRPRIMDQKDIKDVIRWQVDAARRARSAGFDIVYIYAGMGYLGYEFLLEEYNHRSDEYGGSTENRVRFVAELLEATKEAVGDDCGVALRISLEELRAKPSDHFESQAHEVVSRLSDLPDLWDVKMDSSPTDCGSSRFRAEGAHEPVIDFVKQVTDRPVVGVGRFTSPDTMVSQIKRGVLDLIGGARPSIADPFLPNKVREGREDEIRECIGCNICISSWHDGVPVRCTQNATVGEEWRKGWHPEKFDSPGSNDRILIIGGGPAGLEAALVAAKRGYRVAIADKASEMGGRLLFETGLPGLNSWSRVQDYRLYALQQMGNVDIYTDSELGVEEVLGLEYQRVAIATGARWTRSLYSSLEIPVGELNMPNVFTPDDLAAGTIPEGPVLVYDFDNYYLGGVIAEHLAAQGIATSYATPAGHASAWTIMTNELPFVQQALHRHNVAINTEALLDSFDGEQVQLANIFTGALTPISARSVVIVGLRLPNTDLFDALSEREPEWKEAGIKSVDRIGDALAAGALVHATYSGHSYARQLDCAGNELYLRDIPVAENPPGPVI